MHKRDEPNTVVDFLDTEFLPGENNRDVDLLSVHADAPALSDDNISVVEGVVDFRQSTIISEQLTLVAMFNDHPRFIVVNINDNISNRTRND